MEELKITYLRPEELTPYDGNTRKHAPEDIGQIKASIQADGFNDPIGIWGSHNLIVEGHGRRIAAMELGLEMVPCIRLDHLTEAQRRDYAIRHNYTSDLSEFDFGKLDEEVAALQVQGMDMSYLEDLKDELTQLDGDDGAEPGVNTEPSFNYKEQYAVTVMCADEADQRKVYERLTAEGYDCRVVCV